MIVFPAIDIKDGKCVRLRQGRAEDVTVYADDPLDMAHHWVDQGAAWLHVVDLDGAFAGEPANTDLIVRIAAAVDVAIEVGGGIRTTEHVRTLIDGGIRRAIVGTKACSDPDLMAGMVDEFGEQVAVSIDARDGIVQLRGWEESSGRSAIELAREMEGLGVGTIVYTDIAKDGMLQGPNGGATADLCAAVTVDVIASGGVSSIADVLALRALQQANLSGAIIGRALYEGTVDLPQLLSRLNED